MENGTLNIGVVESVETLELVLGIEVQCLDLLLAVAIGIEGKRDGIGRREQGGLRDISIRGAVSHSGGRVLTRLAKRILTRCTCC